MWSQRKELRCDPTSTADDGGSTDPPLFAHHDSSVSALGRRVCPTLSPVARPTRPRTYSAIPVVLDPEKTGIAVHLCPTGLRAALLLYPHPEPANRDRPHSISAARTKAAIHSEPGGSQSAAGSAPQAS